MVNENSSQGDAGLDWALPWPAVPALPVGLFPGRGTEQEGKVLHRAGLTLWAVTSSLAIHTERRDLNFVYSETQSSLALGWQWEEQADEFPVFTPFSALWCVPDSTQIAMTNLSYPANLQANLPSLHTAVSKHGLSAPVQFLCCPCCPGSPKEAVELLSLLDRAGVASLSCTFQAELSCLCWAQPSSFQAAGELPCLPSLWDSFTSSVSHFHMRSLNRIQKKDPTSWSWTSDSEWERLGLYLASSLFAEVARNAALKPLTAPSYCCGIKKQPSSLEEGKSLPLGKAGQRCFSVWSQYEK